MSFLTYQSTRPWAKAIKEAVLSKKMPPWFADPHYGDFRNQPTLTESEVKTLVAWADNGAPRFNFNWQLGYELEPIRVRKGTRMVVVAHHDNSANNPYNPDPTREVAWGNLTSEEMVLPWLGVIVDRNVDPERILGETDRLHRPCRPSPACEFSSSGLAEALNSQGDPPKKIAGEHQENGNGKSGVAGHDPHFSRC